MATSFSVNTWFALASSSLKVHSWGRSFLGRHHSSNFSEFAVTSLPVTFKSLSDNNFIRLAPIDDCCYDGIHTNPHAAHIQVQHQ